MAESPSKRTLWTWALGFLASFALLALTWFFWREVTSFCDRVGNIASVSGLPVSLVGFALTIHALLKTRKIEQDARGRIENAVAKAHQETRDAVARIGQQLLLSECEALGRLASESRRLSTELQWSRAADRCRDTAHSGILLVAHPRLQADEEKKLRAASDNVQGVASFIERNRLSQGSATAPLPRPQTQFLEDMFNLVTNILVRLRREVLETTHADRERQQQA